MQSLNALRTLKEPSNGRTSHLPVELIWNGFLGFGQTCAQLMFGQAIAQQAEYHDQPQCDNALGFFEEHGGGEQKQRAILEKAKATFDAAPSLQVLTTSCSGGRLSPGNWWPGEDG